MIYSTVIIDDESKTRSLLKKLITHTKLPIEVVGEAFDVSSGVKEIREKNPDIVLLDIQMADGSGFDLLDRLSERKFEVVFVTAHQEFAIRAIKFSALDYILKPVELKDLKDALQNTIDVIQTKSDLSVKYETLLKNIKQENKRIVISTKTAMYVYAVKDIIRCQSDRNYTCFFLVDGKKVYASRTLKDYEDILTPPHFIRCHRSHIINLDFLDRYETNSGGSIILKDGTEIPLSRQSKSRFLEILKKL